MCVTPRLFPGTGDTAQARVPRETGAAVWTHLQLLGPGHSPSLPGGTLLLLHWGYPRTKEVEIVRTKRGKTTKNYSKITPTCNLPHFLLFFSVTTKYVPAYFTNFLKYYMRAVENSKGRICEFPGRPVVRTPRFHC